MATTISDDVEAVCVLVLDDTDTTAGWPASIQLLIEYGHRFDDVLDYTFAQIETFLSAIECRERYKRKQDVISLRAAQAEDKAVKSYLKSL